MSALIKRVSSSFQVSKEEKSCSDLLFSDVTLSMGDARLNNLAALTYNETSCQNIFTVVEKALNPVDNAWSALNKVWNS